MEKFTLKDTNTVKGIAILMLLWHHLFFNLNIEFIKGTNTLTGMVAYYGKICVAIFIVLSGYGLTESYKRNPLKPVEFYKKNLKKLYLNYWLIWLVFVPIGILFFGRTLTAVYGDHVLSKLLINITGFQRVFGFEGYNATWWFMSLILGLYIIYPLIIKHIRNNLNLSLLIAFFIMLLPSIKIFGMEFIFVYGSWVFPFVLGIYMSEKKVFEKVKESTSKMKLPILLTLLIFLCLFRRFGRVVADVRIDGFIAIVIILIVYLYISKLKYLSSFLEYIGKKSFDIFLFHTFIYYYYFSDFIYSFSNHIIIFIVLLAICLIIAYLLERLKKLIVS